MSRQDSPQGSKSRLEFLDALRGLAAIYVVVYHLILLPQPNLVVPRWAEKFAHAGGTGVTLFFIVSAFSLYYTMPLRERDGRPVLSFYLHRFFRIAPLFYLLIILSVIRDYFEFGVLHPITDILVSASFIFNLLPTRQEGFVWAGWTIGVEMVFYAVFPLIYQRVKGLGNAVAFTFGCLLLWIFVKLVLDYLTIPDIWKQSISQWNALRHFPIFAVGIVTFHAFSQWSRNPSPHQGWSRELGNALLLVGIFAYVALLQGWLPNVFGDIYYWQGVVYGLIFMGLAMAPWRSLVNGVTTWLGKVSYSIYLLHTTVIYFMAPVYRMVYAHSPSLSVAFVACLALTFAITLPLSAVTYRWVELPGIKLGKKLAWYWVLPHGGGATSPTPRNL